MDGKVIVEVKTSFGIRRIYPVNDTAKLFTDISKTTTLSQEDVNIIKALGFAVEVQAEQIVL